MDINALFSILPVKVATLLLALAGVCSAFVALVPPPKNLRTAWGFFYQALDWVALNIGHGTTAAKAVAKGKLMRVPAPGIVLDRSRL